MITRIIRKIGWLLLSFTLARAVMAFDEFVVEDIRLQGLQHIAPGTVFTYLPLKAGDTLDEGRSPGIIRALYQTGFFHDIQLSREGNLLVVTVVERPAIASVKITGNEEIDSDMLKKGFKDIGLTEGRIFNRSILDKVEQELKRQYFSRGKYAVRITTTVKEAERNRVDIAIEIDEGEVAEIRRINIVGNQAFTEAELLDKFTLGIPSMLAFFSDADKYSKQKLIGDLEVLRSHYLDRGYINFNIESTQVAISPDKQDIYLTINITEGEQYRLSGVKLAGDLIVPEQELMNLVTIREGDIFSRKVITGITTAINERLGEEGYAFANVNAVPEVAREDQRVALTIFVDPGKRVYVRRINVTGNTKTFDEVVRREMRQMEGGWISTQKVSRSRTRLERLGYLKEVNVETTPVPGTSDQVDVNFNVTEGSSGSLMAAVGYGEASGALFNASIAERNFLGTGKWIKLEFDHSQVNDIYSLSYTNPYYTLDGVSRGIRAYSRKTDAGEANVSSYLSDEVGAEVNYGIPISEYITAGISIGLNQIEIKTTSGTPLYINDWVTANGSLFDRAQLTASWTYDTRDRTLFANRGVLQSLSAELAIPGSDLEYYKLNYRQEWYFPLKAGSTLRLQNMLGYADGYGDTADLPFFENYYMGGINSVRAYRTNSLGPKDIQTDRSKGGDRKIQLGAELIFPSPFEGTGDSFRWSYFVDAGNVFGSDESVDLSELRASHGVSAKWITPVGALVFSYGWGLNEKPGDKLDRFQFTIGAPF
ncbi:MAG: outer membrane protein assembly factor BamA [Gammaproteobacteria bacterium RBG_16_57_12]|nr:MAG: outer membrane protein assembly factor BamA [Gammaproteobacteria bacterium RBG_16_57_12]